MAHQGRAIGGTGEVGYESEEGRSNAATPTAADSACVGEKEATQHDQTVSVDR